MRKVLCVVALLVIMIGAASGIALAKTLYVVDEGATSNGTQTPADALATDVKLTTYNNQCMELTFSVEGTVMGGVTTAQISFFPLIDGQAALPTGWQGQVYWNPPTWNYFDTTSFTWYKCGLNIGRHTVKVQYNPTYEGDTAVLRARLLKINIKSGKIVPPIVGTELGDLPVGTVLEDGGMVK